MFTKLHTTYQLLLLLHKQKRIPTRFWLIGIGVILYILKQVDLIPDAIIILGWADDVALAYFAYQYIQRWLQTKITPADKAKAEAINVQPK